MVEKAKSVMIRPVKRNSRPLGGQVPEDDAMQSDSRSVRRGEGGLEELMRERIRATIETITDEEFAAALGAARSQRVDAVRAGHRHGKRERRLTNESRADHDRVAAGPH